MKWQSLRIDSYKKTEWDKINHENYCIFSITRPQKVTLKLGQPGTNIEMKKNPLEVLRSIFI